MIRWTVHYRPWMGFFIFFGGCLTFGTLRRMGTITQDAAGWLGWGCIITSVLLGYWLPPGPCAWWYSDDYGLFEDDEDGHEDTSS